MSPQPKKAKLRPSTAVKKGGSPIKGMKNSFSGSFASSNQGTPLRNAKQRPASALRAMQGQNTYHRI